VEFGAEAWNLPVSVEFLHFSGMLQNSVLAGNKKGTNTAYFGRIQAAV